jgi:diacylglycerol kinase (ATP)
MSGWLAAEVRLIAMRVVWSWRGWRDAWRTQKSLRQWSWVNVLSASLAFALPLAASERALILAPGILVLAAELLNTAIEATVDYVSDAPHRQAALAKDCASAGVALVAIAGGVAWLCLLWGVLGR